MCGQHAHRASTLAFILCHMMLFVRTISKKFTDRTVTVNWNKVSEGTFALFCWNFCAWGKILYRSPGSTWEQWGTCALHSPVLVTVPLAVWIPVSLICWEDRVSLYLRCPSIFQSLGIIWLYCCRQQQIQVWLRTVRGGRSMQGSRGLIIDS